MSNYGWSCHLDSNFSSRALCVSHYSSFWLPSSSWRSCLGLNSNQGPSIAQKTDVIRALEICCLVYFISAFWHYILPFPPLYNSPFSCLENASVWRGRRRRGGERTKIWRKEREGIKAFWKPPNEKKMPALCCIWAKVPPPPLRPRSVIFQLVLGNLNPS